VDPTGPHPYRGETGSWLPLVVTTSSAWLDPRLDSMRLQPNTFGCCFGGNQRTRKKQRDTTRVLAYAGRSIGVIPVVCDRQLVPSSLKPRIGSNGASRGPVYDRVPDAILAVQDLEPRSDARLEKTARSFQIAFSIDVKSTSIARASNFAGSGTRAQTFATSHGFRGFAQVKPDECSRWRITTIW
jgi:hypothetical protein